MGFKASVRLRKGLRLRNWFRAGGLGLVVEE